jgi:hypothetical protein
MRVSYACKSGSATMRMTFAFLSSNLLRGLGIIRDNHLWTLCAVRRKKVWEISMTVLPGNLFADVSAASAGEEAVSEIFARPGLKIERIISQGHASPPEFWYDQA